MYYRITIMRFDPAKREALLAHADSVRHEMTAIEGLKSVQIVEVGERHAVGLATYDTGEQAQAATADVQRILGGMAGFMTAPPQSHDGSAMWEM